MQNNPALAQPDQPQAQQQQQTQPKTAREE